MNEVESTKTFGAFMILACVFCAYFFGALAVGVFFGWGWFFVAMAMGFLILLRPIVKTVKKEIEKAATGD